MAKKGLTQKKVTLLYGLPGSGKTFYAKENSDEGRYRPTVAVLDVDAIARYLTREGRSDCSWDKIEAHVGRDCCGKLNHRDEVIVDGLITTIDVAKRYMAAIQKEATEQYKFQIHFKVVWWTPDREACLWNDRGRRKVDSTETIKNIPFEQPSEEAFKEFKANVERKKVVRKPVHKAWAGENELGDQDTLESDTWCLGGTGRGYDGYEWSVSPTPQPVNFEAFDKLLEKLCPQISFLQYKKVYAACVTIKESSSSDYYGGSTNYAQYSCDLKKLHEALTQIGVITE